MLLRGPQRFTLVRLPRPESSWLSPCPIRGVLRRETPSRLRSRGPGRVGPWLDARRRKTPNRPSRRRRSRRAAPKRRSGSPLDLTVPLRGGSQRAGVRQGIPGAGALPRLGRPADVDRRPLPDDLHQGVEARAADRVLPDDVRAAVPVHGPGASASVCTTPRPAPACRSAARTTVSAPTRQARSSCCPRSDNVFIQFKDGWHNAEVAAENAQVEWQWTKKIATLASATRAGRDILPPFRRPSRPVPGQTVTVSIGGQVLDTSALTTNEEVIRRVPIAATQFGDAENVDLTIEVNQAFVPRRREPPSRPTRASWVSACSTRSSSRSRDAFLPSRAARTVGPALRAGRHEIEKTRGPRSENPPRAAGAHGGSVTGPASLAVPRRSRPCRCPSSHCRPCFSVHSPRSRWGASMLLLPAVRRLNWYVDDGSHLSVRSVRIDGDTAVLALRGGGEVECNVTAPQDRGARRSALSRARGGGRRGRRAAPADQHLTLAQMAGAESGPSCPSSRPPPSSPGGPRLVHAVITVESRFQARARSARARWA